MTITTERIVETKHQIAIPYFVMGACFSYKIINETTCIQVCHGLPDALSIGLCKPRMALKFDYGEKECTEAEFNKTYRYVQKNFTAISEIGVAEKSELKGVLEAIDWINPDTHDSDRITKTQYTVAMEICQNAMNEVNDLIIT